MRLYKLLSGVRLLKNYTAKFMLIAFLGIHIPLFGVIGVLGITAGAPVNKTGLFLLVLGLTLLSTVVTLWVLSALTIPLKKAQLALSNYLISRTIPNLPENFTDEPGLLMRDINTVVSTLHNNLQEKDKVIKALSHDLRAPATNILALLALMKDETDTDELAKYVKRIEESVNRQLSLMDAMVYTYEG
jgi:signal transduction histidine kinase